MSLATPRPDTAVCPRCGADLRCGMAAGDAECWCARLPQVMPVPSAPPRQALLQSSAASCFCPACLKQITDERHHTLYPPRD
ncbi:MAG: cysteine-rich CWC family protein [Polaromonas sp.]|nr:cysteine-rich CWC family protein [Polaromonas sp.]